MDPQSFDPFDPTQGKRAQDKAAQTQPDIPSPQPEEKQPEVSPTQESPLYDVIVIGGGPAGVAAAVYSARKQLKTLLIADSFGGQSVVSDDIQNWIGEPHISGMDLAKKLEAHVKSYPDIVTVKEEKVTKVVSHPVSSTGSINIDSRLRGNDSSSRMCDFEVTTDPSTDSTSSLQASSGQVFRGKTVIVASGARRRKMGIPGEDKFSGKGVAYCSTCDAPVFVGRRVAVVGGGNAGLEAVQDLFPYATEIYLLERGDSIRGDDKTYEEIQKNPKFKGVMLNTQTLEVLGEAMVTGIKVKDLKTNEEKVLEIGGIFVEIGSVPNSEMVKDLVQIDEHGQIMINFQHARTSHPGIFAAGDVTDDPYKQNNISVGDGVRAALAAYNYLLDRQKHSPAAEESHV